MPPQLYAWFRKVRLCKVVEPVTGIMRVFFPVTGAFENFKFENSRFEIQDSKICDWKI